MKAIDKFLNNITMYALVMRGLVGLALYAIIVGFIGLISYSGWSMIVTLVVIMVTALLLNFLLSKLYGSASYTDSTTITAFILFFILLPSTTTSVLLSVTFVTAVAISSKYVITYRRRQIFNPAAVGALAAGYMLSGAAIWWVGSIVMIIPVAILGFLVVRKTRRFSLFSATVLASFVAIIILALINNISVWEQFKGHLLSWPIIFFASIMVTEPLSTPPTRKLQIIYGLGVGALSAIPFHFGVVYGTPELALLVGNIFTFIFGMRERLVLVFKEKKMIAKDTYEFIFGISHKPHYVAGQYMEFLIPHEGSDDRGIRRYFTIASAPSDPDIRLGVRMIPGAVSTFKNKLQALEVGQTISASRLAGDFVRPKDVQKKLVFIAGGIGITPFRSIISDMLDKNEKRNVTLFYANKTPDDIAYKDIWARAESILGIKVVHVIAEKSANWQGESGFITEAMIKKYVNDFHEVTYYISGPSVMVEAYKTLLRKMGIPRHQIVTDYFPGFA